MYARLLPTSCANDGCDITHASIALSTDQIARIRMLASEVQRLGVLKIEEFDYSLEWFTGGIESERSESERVDVPCCCVYADSVTWTCVEHYGADEVSTEAILLRDLPV